MTGLIDHGRLLEAMGREVALLVDAAHSVHPDQPVRMCPGWTVDDVVRHVGSVYRVARAWLVEGQQPSAWQRDPAPTQTSVDYLRDGFTALAGELERHGPDEPAATWWPGDQTYGFWCRRMAHDTTMHRVDLEEEAGRQLTGIDADLAADGVDEALMLWFSYRLPRLGLAGTRLSTVAVRTEGHTWIARAGPSETVAWYCAPEDAERESQLADSVVSGSADLVYRWLWGRERLGAVRVDGDEDAVGQLWALMRLATR